MLFRLKKLSALSVALLVGLTACENTTGPAGELDAEATTADLAALEATFETDAFEALAALGDNFSSGVTALASGSAMMLEETRDPKAPGFSDRALQISDRVASALTESSAPVPLLQEFAGTTFVYSPAEGRYIMGEEPGPETGVRFIAYAVNPITEEIAEPLTPIGHVDILDVNPAPGNEVAVQVIVVSGEVTYVDYIVSATLGSESGLGATVNATGYLTDGTVRADFDLTHTALVDFTGATITIDYSVEVVERDFGIDVAITVVGTEGSASTEFNVRLTHEGNFVLITGTAENDAGELEVRLGSGSGDGDLWATISLSPTGVTILGADGEALTQDELQMLQRVWNVIEEAFDIFEELFDPVEWIFNA